MAVAMKNQTTLKPGRRPGLARPLAAWTRAPGLAALAGRRPLSLLVNPEGDA